MTRPREDARVWRTSDAVHVDVRGLEPPDPMIAILRLLDHADAGSVIVAHLDREPIFLYPELDDRGWSYELISSSGGGADGREVTLRLVRLST